MYQRDTTEEDGASDEEEGGEETEAPAAAGPPPKKKKQHEIEMLLQSGDEEEESGGGAKQEMENYLRDMSKVKSESKEQSGSPAGSLAWWKANSDRYPKLALAAKYCLCIPATSTP